MNSTIQSCLKQRIFRLSLLAAICACSVFLSRTARADTYSWKEPVDGAWEVAENWDPPGVPGSDDDVSFPEPGTGFEVNVGDATVGSIENGGALINVSGTLRIIDKLTWNLGGFIGDGVLELPEDSETTISGPHPDDGFLLLTVKTFNNHGTITWASGDLAGGEGATWNNFDMVVIEGSVNFTWPGVTDNATFRNHPGAQLIVGSEVTTDNWIIINDGLINVLPFSNFLLGLGGTRRAEFNDKSRIAGLGQVELHVHTAINGDAHIDGNLLLGGNGSIEGPGTLHINDGGLLVTRGGLLDSPLGQRAKTVIEQGGRMEIADGVYMNVRLLENRGVIEWLGGDIAGSEQAMIDNYSQFLIKCDRALTWASASTNSIFSNLENGSIIKSGTTNSTTFEQFRLLNSSAIHVISGNIVLAQGNHAFQKGTSLSGAGHLVLTNAATLQIVDDVLLGIPFNPARFELAGGTITGPATLTIYINSEFDWTSGEFVGPGKTVMQSGAKFRIFGEHAKTITDAYILENNANVPWTGSGDINLTEGSIFVNNGFLRLQDAVSFVLSAPTENLGLFDNREQGFVIKELNDTTSFFDGVPITNKGTIKVDAGTLHLRGTLQNYSDEFLLGGRYVVSNILVIDDVNIRTNAATVVMAGPNAKITDQNGTNGLAEFFLNLPVGNFTVESGFNYSMDRTLFNHGEIFVGPDSTLSILAPGHFEQINGTTFIQQGTLRASQLLYLDGELHGQGSIFGDVTSSALISPGDLFDAAPAGILTINGDLEQTLAGAMRLSLGGPLPGVSLDNLKVTGSVKLAGRLEVPITHDYLPNLGEEFPVLFFSSRLGGGFNSFPGASIGRGLYLEPVFEQDHMLLRVTDQPPGTRFTQIKLEGGKIVLTVDGITGLEFELHGSTDLLNWRVIEPSIKPPVTLELAVEPSAPLEFYRLLQK